MCQHIETRIRKNLKADGRLRYLFQRSLLTLDCSLCCIELARLLTSHRKEKIFIRQLTRTLPVEFHKDISEELFFFFLLNVDDLRPDFIEFVGM